MTDNRDLVRVARAAAVNDLEWHFRGADGAIAKGRLIDMQRAQQARRAAKPPFPVDPTKTWWESIEGDGA